MANFPTILPLICNTPPPIDDAAFPNDDNDEAYDDFVLNTENDYTSMNLDANGGSNTVEPYPANQTKNESSFKPVEVFNLAISITPPPLDFDNISVANPVETISEEEEYSACSTFSEQDCIQKDKIVENESASRNLSEINKISINSEELNSSMQVQAITKFSDEQQIDENYNESEKAIQTMNRQSLDSVVTLEDVQDDSDNEHLSNNNKSLVDENADDFFAIHEINAEIQATPIRSSPNTKEKFENNTTETQHLSPQNEDDFDDFAEFATFERTSKLLVMETGEGVQKKSELKEKDAEFIFEANFEELNSGTISKAVDNRDDEFEDFQNFTYATIKCNTDGNDVETESVRESVIAKSSIAANNNNDDDDDDFGEFADSTTMPSDPTELTFIGAATPTTINQYRLDEHIRTILGIMFPNTASDTAHTYEESINITNTDKLKLNLESVEAAKALDFHWVKSQARHSLIKSLGIDSRNILYGGNWSSSVPRFAANLTFSPLEPLKPLPINQQHSTCTKEVVHNLKADGRTIKSDWSSSGLENPIGGSKEVPRNTREIETNGTEQSGTFSASFDQSKSCPVLANVADNRGEHAPNTESNTTSTSSTIPNATTTATLSSTISSNGVCNSLDDNSYNINIISSSTHINTSPYINTVPTTTIVTTTNPIATVVEKSYLERKDAPSASIQSSSASTIDASSSLTIFSPGKDEDVVLDEVVVTSTFSGPLKETHIYTPSKKDDPTMAKPIAVKATKPIDFDFDYEIAAAGTRIDETVVRKEYRDVEYNPGYVLEFDSVRQNDIAVSEEIALALSKHDQVTATLETDDEFTEYQFVPPASTPAPKPVNDSSALRNIYYTSNISQNTSGNSTPTFGGRREMILSPAILLPQAIPMESNKPKIEWGGPTASINPDELARIEELFPQQRPEAINAQKCTTPKQQYSEYKQEQQPIRDGGNKPRDTTLTISAAIAQKEMLTDEDDWTEFISVPVQSVLSQNSLKAAHPNAQGVRFNNGNNNNLTASFAVQHAALQQLPHTAAAEDSIANEEEWSDFVSSTPAPYKALPQFNSAAWQNANFYNNPLSFYQNSGSTQTHASFPERQQKNNNNNNATSHYIKYQQQQQQQVQPSLFQQRVHIMHDFSATSLLPTQHRTAVQSATISSSASPHLQMGCAKVAPSISLIPDLGFISPATPAHTAFINALPKPSFIRKK